jgi:ABC-type lipoprotein export system ATPase subunit
MLSVSVHFRFQEGFMGFFTFPWMVETTNQKSEDHPMIELRGVHKSYQTASGDYPVLKGIDLSFRAGEFNSIIGKSGSGKTTLLNMITGIDRPTSGEVWVNGSALHELSESQLAHWRGQNMGIIFQFFQLLPTLSILENILLAMDFCGKINPDDRKQRAMYLLDLVGLADHAYKLPLALSGGQQQRAAIARALANDPPVLIADEPTGNLDSKTAESVFELFNTLVEQGKTIIIVTHDGNLARRTNRTATIVDGMIADENILRALPFLNSEQLQHITQHTTREQYPAGQLILDQKSDNKDFYIVTSGKVENFLQQNNHPEIQLIDLEKGQYFGNLGLTSSKNGHSSARASMDAPVEVLKLDHKTIKELLAESQPIHDAVFKEMDKRHQQIVSFTGD